ncbi:MAG: hypothetical protein H7Y38_19770, partial [Armatimonadetes bacterium]|nr:hypothetical protein [Armatimonadota bacterium]
MKRIAIYPAVTAALSLGLFTLLAGCGGDDNNDTDLTSVVSPTPLPSPSASPVATDNQNVSLTFSDVTATRSDFTPFTNSNRGSFGT